MFFVSQSINPRGHGVSDQQSKIKKTWRNEDFC